MSDYLFRKGAYIEAVWCVDSETSEEHLIDLRTGITIAKRINGKIVDPGDKSC